MFQLLLGLGLWCVGHLMVATAPKFRSQLVKRLTLTGYKLCFSLLMFTSLGLMILGWQSMLPKVIYMPNHGLATPATVLIYLAFLLLVASKLPGHLRALVRHPQLTAITLWALGHLLTNGDLRSVLLFGLLGLWALVEILLINRNQGKWNRPTKASLWGDLAAVCLSLGLFAGSWAFHGELTGIALP